MNEPKTTVWDCGCECEGDQHETNCRFNPEYDPTPWCSGCGSRTKSGCHCGPLADND